MAVGCRFLCTAVVAWSIVAQILIICSGGDAYPTNDFFFNDQLSKVVRRSVEDMKSSNDETILNDMPNDDGGSGNGDDEPDEVIGSGFSSGYGEDSSTNVEVQTNDEDGGSGDDEPGEDIGSGGGEDLSTTDKTQTNEQGSGDDIGSGGAEDLNTTANIPTNEQGSGDGDDEPGEDIGSGFASGDGEDLNPITNSHTMTQEVSITDQTEKTNEEGTTELSLQTLPTTREPPLELVSIEVCGKRYYCPKGSRGPCPANEILIVENESKDSTDPAPSYCSALSNYPWRGCLSQVSQETDAASLSARCSLKSKEEPCSGLPPNYRYDPVKKMCRPASISKGDWLVYECGDDQVYTGLNRQMGSCRCINELHLIYTAENKCYHPFTRGPCDNGMWLEPSSRREAICVPSPCPENQIDGRHFYWKGHFHGPAGCYRTNTRGPCPENSLFVVTNYVLGHARCSRK